VLPGVPRYPGCWINRCLLCTVAEARHGWTDQPAEKLARLGLKAATGTNNWELRQELVTQVTVASPLPDTLSEYDKNRRMGVAIAALADIKPQDTVEGTLAVQMVLTHHASVDRLRHGAENT
jgi:hypothetical protein